MANPVWVLSVNLETKSAAFVSGMSDAAKAARGAFQDIRAGANEAGRSVGGSMFAARHALMSVSDMFGVTLPRALTAFISDIGPVGAALEAAFPFAAVALGAFLLLEHLTKLKEAGRALTLDQEKFATAAQNAFNGLDQKMLQAQIRSDELRNDHLGALHHQLALINRQSLDELAHQFEQLQKTADKVLVDLKVSWYQFGQGSLGAKNALDEFQAKYESLLAHGKAGEASDLLKGTRESAESSLKKLEEIQAKAATMPAVLGGMGGGLGAMLEGLANARAEGVEKEIKAQHTLLDLLRDQETIQQKTAGLAGKEGDNAQLEAAKQAAAQHSEAARASAESSQRIAESGLAADRATADAALAVKRASIQERLAVEMDFAARERDIQLRANEAEVAALNRMGPEYNNQLKALREKALEISAQYAAKTAQLSAKASTEQAAEDLRTLEESERAKIEATREGSNARLAAIATAIRQEEALGLQDTAFYRDLLTQRVSATRALLEEQARIEEEEGKKSAENTIRLGDLLIARAKQQQELENSIHRATLAKRVQQEMDNANMLYAIQLAAMQRQIQALDQGSREYLAKKKAFEDQEKALEQQHENEIAAIKAKAEIQQNAQTAAAMAQMRNLFAAGMTSVLMGHRSFASEMNSIGDQVASGMIQNALKSMLADDMSKEKDAARAARKMFNAGADLPFPANIVAAPAMGAAAFAAVMAFKDGTDSVPGVGRGDTVPALLEPGEGVVPGGVMDNLSKMSKNGGFDRGPSTVLHLHMTNHLHALDGAGMDKVLDKHADTIQKHVNRSLRKANRQ